LFNRFIYMHVKQLKITMVLASFVADAHLLCQADWIEDELALREEASEVLDEFGSVMEMMEKDEPEAVIMAGDMFDYITHRRHRVAHREGEKYMMRIKSILKNFTVNCGCKIYAIKGNHDSVPVLKSLEESLEGRFIFADNMKVRIGETGFFLMSSHYVTGPYDIDLSTLERADVLVMHESLPIEGMSGLPLEKVEEICKRYRFVFNGHMHFYQGNTLGFPNLFLLPALVPSREIKNNWVLKYRWDDGRISPPEERESPFGYVLFDGEKVTLKRFNTKITAARLELLGNDNESLLRGVKELYERLMERPNVDRLRVWVVTNASPIFVENVLWSEVKKFNQIYTVDIISERRQIIELSTPSVRDVFMDKAFTIDELLSKLATSLKPQDWLFCQKLFQKVFTKEVLESRNPDKTGVYRLLLDVIASEGEVSTSFHTRAYEASKLRGGGVDL